MGLAVFQQEKKSIFPVGSVGKESAFNVGDSGSIPAESDMTVHLSSSSILVKL